jgi:hypothetical protein
MWRTRFAQYGLVGFPKSSEAEGMAMVSAVGVTTSSGSNNQSQIRSLEKQLAKYEKELTSDEASKNTTAAQLVATQITLVESEIAQLSKITAPPVKQNVAVGASTGGSGAKTGMGTTSVLGNNIDTSA